MSKNITVNSNCILQDCTCKFVVIIINRGYVKYSPLLKGSGLQNRSITGLVFFPVRLSKDSMVKPC